MENNKHNFLMESNKHNFLMESNIHNFLMESNIHNLNSFQNQQIINLNWRIKMEMYAFKSTDIGSANRKCYNIQF